MSEKVGIEINLINADQAEATLKRIEASTKRLGASRTKIQMEDGSLISVNERIKQIQDRLAALSAAKKMGVITKAETAEAKRLSAELKVISRGLKDGTANAKTFSQVFNSVSSKVAHVGSAMQSMGNALTRLGSFMRPITTGLLMGAGYKALNLITEGFSGAFERADIMRNYSRTLEAFGFSAQDATDSVEELNEAVLGLPTGLDEMVAIQKRFVAASNDLKKSTGVAIAFNNAILASGSDARQRKTAERIMTQLVGGAEIAASSWDALQRAIPMVFNALAKESNMGVADYVKALKNGDIATDEFIKNFERIGREGAIADAADVMKQSWGGLSANIINAAKRMGQGIIESLNSVFEQETGRNLLQTLLGIDAEGNRTFDGIRDWIDDISQSAQNWIKANPDKIINFFETLKSIDLKGFLKGTAEGIGDIVGYMERLAKISQNVDMEKWGRRLSKAGFFGNLLTIGGGLLKGTRHIWGGIGAGGSWLFGKGKGGGLGGLGGLGGAGGGGLGGFSTAGIAGGLNVAKWVGIIGGIATIATTLGRVNMANVKASFESFRQTTESIKGGLENISQIKATDVNMGAVKDLVKKVSEVYQALSGIPMSVSVSKRMAKSTEKIRDTIFQLRRAAYQINQAAGTTVDSGGFAAFVEQIRTSLDALRDLSGELMLDIEVKLSPLFGSSVNAVKTNIKNAKRDIEKMKTPISMYIPVTVTFSVTTNLLSALAKIRRDRQTIANANGGTRVYDSSISGGGHNANGGLIYRARGGGVGFPGRPIGTDRVPAWLTPGEYVHNKRAVSMFGIDFMRKVNSLDMKGAMNELMHRAGHMANVNRGANITNNNYNNQKVVINNNNAGAGFTFKSASRFVGAF